MSTRLLLIALPPHQPQVSHPVTIFHPTFCFRRWHSVQEVLSFNRPSTNFLPLYLESCVFSDMVVLEMNASVVFPVSDRGDTVRLQPIGIKTSLGSWRAGGCTKAWIWDSRISSQSTLWKWSSSESVNPVLLSSWQRCPLGLVYNSAITVKWQMILSWVTLHLSSDSAVFSLVYIIILP